MKNISLKTLGSRLFFFIRIHKLSVAAERFETWGRGGGGAHLALSHTHSSNQIFQNTVCVVR